MKTIIKIFICLSLIYTPFFAFAGAAENWDIVSNTYDSERNRVKIEARKITQGAANSGRYKVEVPVSPAALGKTVKTMMWTGVAVAGVQAMLEGIGWIIDYGSQSIKRPIGTPQNENQVSQYCWTTSGTCSAAALADNTAEFSPSAMCASTFALYVQIYGAANVQNKGCTLNAQFSSVLTWRYLYNSEDSTSIAPRVPNPQYDPNAIPDVDYEYISDSELGNEIIGKGENKQPLPDAVQDAYSPNNPAQSEPAPQATQDALDNANPQPETEPTGETKPKPNTDTDGDGEPDAYDPAQPEQGTEFQLPNFCSWAPAVCDFFTVQKADNKDIKKNQREQIEQDKTFFEKVAEWFDWSQTDDELPDNESPEIVEHVTPDLKEDAISWGASCPADVSIPISMQGVTSTLVFSWSPWCQLLSIIKPAIIASAYIGAAFIVLGIRT